MINFTYNYNTISMRTVILQEWISLDGFAADKDGSTKFFEDPKYNEGFNDYQLELFERVDTTILGAVTYRMFSEFWPTADAEQEPVAPKLNALQKSYFPKPNKMPHGGLPQSVATMLLMLYGNLGKKTAKTL